MVDRWTGCIWCAALITGSGWAGGTVAAQRDAMQRRAVGPVVLHVDDDAPMGGDGATWATAYRFLQDGLEAAALMGGPVEVRVGQGVHQPDRGGATPGGSGDRSSAFVMFDELILRGGYAGFGAGNPDERDPDVFTTTLSGDLSSDDGAGFTNRADNAHHVMIADGVVSGLVVDGVVIRGGNADDVGAAGRTGGGVRAWNATLELHDCRLIDNEALTAGGAMSVRDGGTVTMMDCLVSDNRSGTAGGIELRDSISAMISGTMMERNAATSSGGAMQVRDTDATISGCVFTQNTAVQGGGAMTIRTAASTISDCVFQLNNAAGSGGAIAFSLSAGPIVEDCAFSFNTAQGDGGAIGAVFFSDPIIRRCTFDDNTADRGGAYFCNGESDAMVSQCDFRRNQGLTHGGAVFVTEISSPQFDNCLMLDNSTPGNGGAVYQTFTGDPVFTNCTMIDNTAGGQGGGVHVDDVATLEFINCIVYNNTDLAGQGEFSQMSGNVDVDYCCIQGYSGALGGTGNTGADPRFGPAPGRLSACSPLIDAGDSSASTGTDDLAELPRLLDDPDTTDTGVGGPPVVDMGAFEFQSPPCIADCSPVDDRGAIGNGVVNIDDLLAVVLVFGQDDAACDVSPGVPDCGNGIINIDDLLGVIGAFGVCPE